MPVYIPGKPAASLYLTGAMFFFGSVFFMGDVVVGLMIGATFCIGGYYVQRNYDDN